MTQIVCPHCMERVDVPEAGDDSIPCCPACMGLLGTAEQDELAVMEYDVSNPNENPIKSDGIRQYVGYLEKRVRIEKRQEPYERRRFPVDLVAGIVLVSLGLLLLASAFLTEGGIMSALIFKVLGSFLLMLLGFLCLRFSAY